mgnify:CR=1 FL=1
MMGYFEMTNSEILQVAMQQSAIDMSCNKEDYEKNENVVILSYHFIVIWFLMAIMWLRLLILK